MDRFRTNYLNLENGVENSTGNVCKVHVHVSVIQDMIQDSFLNLLPNMMVNPVPGPLSQRQHDLLPKIDIM